MIEEYAAAERSDYIEWGQEEQKLDDMDYWANKGVFVCAIYT